MCGAKLMEKKRTGDLMEMLGLKESEVQTAKANGVRWYRHVLRRDDGHVLRRSLEFEVRSKRRQGQPKKTWKMQVERESKNVGLERENALNWARCRGGFGEVNLATPIYGDKPNLDWLIVLKLIVLLIKKLNQAPQNLVWLAQVLSVSARIV